MGQCGKFKFDALVDEKPTKMLKDGQCVLYNAKIMAQSLQELTWYKR